MIIEEWNQLGNKMSCPLMNIGTRIVNECVFVCIMQALAKL